jgi:hypothetical protein
MFCPFKQKPYRVDRIRWTGLAVVQFHSVQEVCFHRPDSFQ